MSLNESIVEEAALEWFVELGGGRVKIERGRVKSRRAFPISLFTIHSFLRGPQLSTGELAAERKELSARDFASKLKAIL